MKLRAPKEDIVFQTLFQRGNETITKALIEAIINEKIEEIDINVDEKIIKEFVEEKGGRLDLVTTINKNKLCNIEIQLEPKEHTIERFLRYWANRYSTQLKIGEEYIKLNKTISVIILGYNIEKTKEMEEISTKWKIIEEKYWKTILTEDFEFYIIELNKAKKIYAKQPENKLAQWMMFIENPNSKEVKEIMKSNKEIEEAMKILDEICSDKEMLDIITMKRYARWEREMDIQDAKESGEKKGENKANIKIIKNMINKGMKIEEICEIVNMNKKKIMELMEQ